jgi:hypothetical protein
MRPVLLLLLLSFSCGQSTLGGPCQQTCDCPKLNAPVKCPGEWKCNSNKTCEYECKSTCEAGTVFTCRAEEDCNGSICSERKACP